MRMFNLSIKKLNSKIFAPKQAKLYSKHEEQLIIFCHGALDSCGIGSLVGVTSDELDKSREKQKNPLKTCTVKAVIQCFKDNNLEFYY